MAQSIRISRQFLVEAMQSAPVREALERRARDAKARAERLAASEGVDMNLFVISGTRPRGRPYSNLVGNNVDQEFGTSKVERRRILGRAAEGS